MRARRYDESVPDSDTAEPLVLVVDDDATIRRLLQITLETEGFSVTTAGDGVEGLRMAQEEPRPDLVLLDIMMPGMDGLQVCHTLKSDPATKDMPVVLLSAKAQSHDIELGLRVGADDYITKPPDLLDLVTRVRQLLPVPAE
ncbi:MAG: two-component system, OmpR family, alkaline phosphatase synthesis response regulator PhoP [Actinomycetota bacterium]